ncbi:MAG TPA: asparagine synthase (glutamine-hydrolyzing) [Vicinamibacterales bacterium]|jgi:asparagine synthase (glutamine-hydrolysing)
MCGIAGKFFSDRSRFHDDDLDRMLRSIVHRGPDSEGRYSDGRALLGFRRLSIIDTTGGDQPLFSEDGEIVVLANGEIYNYKELKVLLRARGHQFRTNSDCEVLVHLYEDFGRNFAEKLNGMYAFCLYDHRRQTLLLGRDRVGIKPLYFTQQDGVLIFASEIKAILQASEVSSIESPDVLDEYLCFRSLSGQQTFFEGVELLAPGRILEADRHGLHVHQYWHPTFREDLISGNETIQLIRDKLQGSVRRQLMSDVPLGTQLSGGVDSSWVSVLAAREAPGMKSFSVGFSELDFDETGEARQVAALGGLEYHEVKSDSGKFSSLLPRIIWHNDEPLTHANSLEIYNLCRYAREHVKVLLTGEGADELFGGYPRYYLCRLGETYERIPAVLQPAIRLATDWLSRNRGRRPRFFLGMTPRDLVFWNAAFARPDKVAWLMDKSELALSNRRALLDETWQDDLSLLDNLSLHEIQNYLQPILLRQDKMSMGASIEARVPILDNDIVDVALSIGAREKIRNLTPKYLFKKAAAKDLPSGIVHKRKIGFGVPVGTWMRKNGALEGFLDRLNDQRCKFPGVSPVKLEKLIHEHREGVVDHQDILWPLLNYSVWRDTYFRQ